MVFFWGMGMIQYGHEGYVLSVLYSESGIEHQRKIQSKIQGTVASGHSVLIRIKLADKLLSPLMGSFMRKHKFKYFDICSLYKGMVPGNVSGSFPLLNPI